MDDQIFIHVGSMERGDCDVHVSYDAAYDVVRTEIIKRDGQNAKQPPVYRTFYIDNDVVPKFTCFINNNINVLRRQDYVLDSNVFSNRFDS